MVVPNLKLGKLGLESWSLPLLVDFTRASSLCILLRRLSASVFAGYVFYNDLYTTDD